MKIELHLLQNFSPSNLNRDDTGAPKDCEFGGHRRARISSQCQKRAVRQAFELENLVSNEHRGARTKRVVDETVELLKQNRVADEPMLLRAVVAALQGQGIGVPLPGFEDRPRRGRRTRVDDDTDGESQEASQDASDDSKSQYLLFVPLQLPSRLVSIVKQHWDEMQQATNDWDFAVGNAQKKKQKVAKYKRLAPTVAASLEQLLKNADKAVDIALFGRMIADKPEWNVDAACQVAQAMSTNRVQMDFDFFTAVDDFKPKDNAGSDMMGTVQFNSSCFYRYAVLDVDSLRTNLDGDDSLMNRAVRVFIQGFVTAIPTGKQNSMAAHNFPSYALAVVREKGQSLSLANAFLKPARPHGDSIDLVDDSIEKLESYAIRLREVLGDAQWISWADRDLEARENGPTRKNSLGALYTDVIGHAVRAAS